MCGFQLKHIMEVKYVMSTITSRLLKFAWLLCLLCLCVLSQSNSQSCITVFDDVPEDNSANCQFGNTSLQVTWARNRDNTVLKLYCKNAFANQKYECSEIPHFAISTDNGWLEVKKCAPSILKCINKVFAQPSRVVQIRATDMIGGLTSDDLTDLTAVDNMQLHLTRNDINLSFISSLTFSQITGGNLQLSPDMFLQENLEYLSLHDNNIRDIPPFVFKGLTNLKYLDIQDNSIEHLGANAFTGLHTLEELEIMANQHATIDPEAFSGLRQLTNLYIKYNQLRLLPNGLFTQLDNLYKISMTNHIELTLDTYAFANLPPSIRVVELPSCRLKDLPEHTFNGSSGIHQLYFQENQLEKLPPKLFATTTGIRYVDFRENKIKELPDKIFSAMSELEHIDLGYNYLSSLEGDLFTYSPHLKEIYLNNNNITHLDQKIFSGTNLSSVSLASNKLKRIADNSPLGWRTKKLDISNNELEFFEDWFIKIDGLETLDLSGNKIQTIKESHVYSTSTAHITIDLRNNSIKYVLRDSTGEKLGSQTSPNVKIYLSNNSLDCDCTTTQLLKAWHRDGIVADFDEITCPNNEKLSNLDVYIQCSKTHALIALIGSSIVGTLMVILILISIFTHRHDIWEYISNIFHKDDISFVITNGANNTTFEMAEEKKLYDLFVSFAHQDAEFVTDKLLPILENDFELKVCVHYRDWVVGDLIPDQIKESVERSKMTMIILTENFLLSQWSNLEFTTAHNLSIEDGTPRVILVLLDEAITRHDKLTIDIKSYIDVNTYLHWEDMYFWDKLQKILPRYGKNKHQKIAN